MESGNYGLGFCITRYTLVLKDATVPTEDRDFDNCRAEGGEFHIEAASPEQLERIVAALVEWHAAEGVTACERHQS